MTAQEALSKYGSPTKAAKALGIPRTTFNSRLAAEALGKTAPTMTDDRERQRLSAQVLHFKTRYNEALEQIEQKDAALEALAVLKGNVDPVTIIEPKHGDGTSEGTVVCVASDWHLEERVGAEVGGLNRYSLDIAQASAQVFFQAALRLTRLLQQDLKIEQMVLPLLGDFITGAIHGEENAEMNELQPVHATVQAQNLIISGIEFLLNHSKLTLTLPCHSGNHARTTKTTRFGAENGHSLEYLMYRHLAAYFRDEPRVRFIIPEGMHSYLDVYDTKIRFQHGHAIKYQGGVGGIYIPVNKAIGQWNKARHADLDVFGHFHQYRDGGNFICNGSMIGYNSFALSIKADFEPPKQALFLLDKKRGRTANWPILFPAR